MRMTWQVRAWHRLRPHRWQTPPPSLPSFPCTAVVCRHSPARARLGKGEFTPAAAQLLDAQERLRLPQTGHGMRMEPRSAAASQVRLLDQAQPGPNTQKQHPAQPDGEVPAESKAMQVAQRGCQGQMPAPDRSGCLRFSSSLTGVVMIDRMWAGRINHRHMRSSTLL